MSDSCKNISGTRGPGRIRARAIEVTYPAEMLPRADGEAEVIVCEVEGNRFIPNPQSIH